LAQADFSQIKVLEWLAIPGSFPDLTE